MVALTLMPISWAAPRSSDTASMAVPAVVLLTNSHQHDHDDNAGSDGDERLPEMVQAAVKQANGLQP